MDLNKTMIIGRLTRDPEMRATPTGVNVCQLSLATNYVYTNQQSGQKVEQVEYHNVVVWRKLAEIANQYLKKGQRVYIEGRLQTRKWDSKEGQKMSRTEIVADNMIMLDGGKGGNADASPVAQSPFSSPRRPADNAPVGQAFTEEELPTIQQGEDIGVEDIPF